MAYVEGRPVDFVRLLPHDVRHGGDYRDGCNVMLGDSDENILVWALTRDDAIRLRNDLDGFLTQRLDIRTVDPETGLYLRSPEQK